jgi:hypothetical protein
MTKRSLHGVELRYVLTFYMSQNGRASIPDLIEALDYYNFAIPEPRSKAVSDALRWEIAHGRVRRLRRGLYGPGEIPRSTEDRICKRVLALRKEADLLGGRDWNAWWDALPG